MEVEYLCRACSRRCFTADVGSCKNCGHYTASGAFNFCPKCAVELDQCTACSKSLKNQPEDDRNVARPHIVTFNHSEDEPLTGTRKEKIKQAQARTSNQSAKFTDWLKANNMAHISIYRELGTIGCIFIQCSLNEADVISKAGFAIIRGD